MCEELCDANPDGEMQSCQECGRLICFDVKHGDDVMRRAYVTESGDLFCDLCGSRQELEGQRMAEEEGGFYFDPDDYRP